MLQRGLHVTKTQHQSKMRNDNGDGDSKLKFVYYYGHAGRGTNSRIKGFLRRGHTGLIKSLGENSDVYITNEYLTTKLCCLCHQPTTHPPKQNGKTNLGTVICTNPKCNGKRYGCIARSRDANAAMNRIVTGVHQQYLGSPPAAFSPSSSPVPTDINKLLQALSFHPGPAEMGMVETDLPVPWAGGLL